jgi:hypothetical protein
MITDKIKQKISFSLKGRKVKPYKRKYKQIWINNGIINTRIKDGDDIPLNFRKGRFNKMPL